MTAPLTPLSAKTLNELEHDANDFQKSGSVHVNVEKLRALIATARRVEQMQAKLDKAAPRTCPECGDHVVVDEDLCCATCGSETTEIVR